MCLQLQDTIFVIFFVAGAGIFMEGAVKEINMANRHNMCINIVHQLNHLKKSFVCVHVHFLRLSRAETRKDGLLHQRLNRV